MCTAFVGGCPTLPVYLGELQCRALGVAVHAFDPDGNELVNEVGELVITEPMPSMPLFFWNDPDGARYRASYFEMYPGIWRHGDWIEITDRGTSVIYGRSDSTINRQGVRMGTSEIYRAVLAVPEVEDALVVDVPRPGSEAWMPLFVVLAEGAALDDDLKAAIKRRVREDCSPRHVPNEIYVIEEVPRTLSGKVLEIPVKKILMGTSPESAASRDSLANPGVTGLLRRTRRLARGNSLALPPPADVGVQAVDQAEAQLERGRHRPGVERLGLIGVLMRSRREPVGVQATDRDGGIAGGARDVGARARGAAVPLGAEVALLLRHAPGQLDQPRVQPQRQAEPVARPVARPPPTTRAQLEDNRVLAFQAPPPHPPHLRAHSEGWPLARARQHEVDREVLGRVAVEGGGQRERDGHRAGVGVGARDRLGEGHVEQQRQREEDHDAGQELHDPQRGLRAPGDAQRGHGREDPHGASRTVSGLGAWPRKTRADARRNPSR